MANTEPKAIIDSILSQIGIQRVISVDDKYSQLPEVSDVLGFLGSIPAESLQERLRKVPNLYSPDADVLTARTRAFWTEQSDEAKGTFLSDIQFRAEQDDPQAASDTAAIRNLPVLFQSWDFRAMGLSEWKAVESDVFKESEGRKTMVLFDEDFRDQQGSATEGLTLVKNTLERTKEEHLICCLVSHKYQIQGLQDEWRRVCKENDFPEHRVIIIPKELLRDSPRDFAGLIKLAAVSKYYEELRSHIQDTFQRSIQVASERIRELSLYDLDQIVFVSSDREGVWEPDTMIRLLSIFHQGETRGRAIQNPELRAASESIRRISGISTPMNALPSDDLWKIHHLENYEDSGPINELHRPTDLGDIYEMGNGKRYILIAPQCDLMVRTNGGFRGTYKDLIKEAMLAAIVEGEPKAQLGWKLDYFEQGRPLFVDFKRTMSVRLLCLDLCVLNSDGVARAEVGAETPQLLIPAWVKRHEVIAKYAKEIVATYKKIDPKGKQQDYVSKQLTKANNEMTVWGSVDPANGVIVMNLKRIGRLLPPRSTALLKAFCEFLNRDAFDHSFISEVPKAVGN